MPHPSTRHGFLLSPPCLPHRPLLLASVPHPSTRHGFLFCPPVLPHTGPYSQLACRTLHKAWLLLLSPPCSTHRPLLYASVPHPSTLHGFLLPPPCFTHKPLPTASVPHPATPHGFLFCPLCFTHRPLPQPACRTLHKAWLLTSRPPRASHRPYSQLSVPHPSTRHGFLFCPPCFQHRPLLIRQRAAPPQGMASYSVPRASNTGPYSTLACRTPPHCTALLPRPVLTQQAPTHS